MRNPEEAPPILSLSFLHLPWSWWRVAAVLALWSSKGDDITLAGKLVRNLSVKAKVPKE